MSFFTTSQILENSWNKMPTTSNQNLPKQNRWLKDTPPKFEDIETWECIYDQPGNVGIYAAWSPLVEMYIIVNKLFVGTDLGIEVYYGNTAAKKVWKRSQKFGINLPVNKIWSNDNQASEEFV